MNADVSRAADAQIQELMLNGKPYETNLESETKAQTRPAHDELESETKQQDEGDGMLTFRQTTTDDQGFIDNYYEHPEKDLLRLRMVLSSGVDGNTFSRPENSHPIDIQDNERKQVKTVRTQNKEEEQEISCPSPAPKLQTEHQLEEDVFYQNLVLAESGLSQPTAQIVFNK